MGIQLFLTQRPNSSLEVGERIRTVSNREFEISERIACGGNAVVHKCIERSTGDEFAVKFQLSLSEKRVARFQKEVELLKGVRHEQMVEFVDHGTCDAKRRSGQTVKLCFLVMSLAEGTLEDVIQEKRSISYEEYIGQFKGLARALGRLHEVGIHRDIKPGNILVKGETWLLSDFGLCKFDEGDRDLTGDDEPVGPRYWMSPEAVNRMVGNGDSISKGSDVFQLCSVFWFVVTGRHPTGCVTQADWTGPENIYDVLFHGLSHCHTRRPADGNELVEWLDLATLPKVEPVET